MGLTLHYSLKHTGDETSARQRIEQLHQAAQDLPFKELGDIMDLKGKDCEFVHRDREDPLRWLLVQARGSLKLDQHQWLDVAPTRVIAFETWPGEGCETANFGLCQYPATIEHQGKRLRTNLGGWTWSSFCKTQYASDPQCGGLGNFLRCHLSVIALLDQAREFGVLDLVRDEGGFWDHRDVKALVPEIESWNRMIAAFVGQLKDTLGDGVDAPTTEFRNFEQLEQAGQAQLPPQMQELVRLIKQVAKKR
jgi:hypothetical protein